MLTQRFHAPSAAGSLASQDLLGILKLMSAPDDIRQMLLDANKAEAGARAALAELAEAQKKLDDDQAANVATEARQAATETRLADLQRKLENDREDLAERVSRCQAQGRQAEARKQELDTRETRVAASEADLASRRAAIDELMQYMDQAGIAQAIAGNR